MSTESLVLDALVEGGKVIRKADKTGRVWFSLANEQEAVALAQPRRGKAKARALPVDWKASESLREWARREHGCSDALINAHEAYFIDWARSGEKVYADWDATFRNAVRGDWGDIRKKWKPGAASAAMPGVIW